MIIDVSVHNGKLDWTKLKPQIEGAILRCGYGTDKSSQDDKQWARNVSECERLGIPYGVYLYSYAATEDAARSEAQHVQRLLKGHTLQLPVFFDIEENKLQHSARKNFYTFAETIGREYRVGLYTGEYYYNSCMQGTAADWLWIAKYGRNDGQAHNKPVLQDGKTVHLWQYTSKALNTNMDASLILDRSILDTSTVRKTVTEVAREVINGKWGNGDDRKNRLAAAGYSYTEVQAAVNRLLARDKRKSVDTIAREVIAGKWGNGKERTERLEAAGYDAAQIQHRVNELV